MIVALPFPATLADLMKVEGKAELVGGRIVEYMASGFIPCRLAGRIYRSLSDFTIRTGTGEAFGDNLGYAVDPPLTSGRQPFSPDSSFHAGPFPPNDMAFIEVAPTFAIEVRSENDYGRIAETAIAVKRPDYFEAGTLAVGMSTPSPRPSPCTHRQPKPSSAPANSPTLNRRCRVGRSM